MRKLILLGAGGHCKACVDIIEQIPRIKIKAIIDINLKKLNIFEKYKINDENIIDNKKFSKDYFLVTVGQIKSPIARKNLFVKFSKKKYKFITIKSKNSIVSNYSKIDDGTIIMNFSYVGPDVSVGKNCIINNYASIEHESIIGDHCHISTGVRINGNCSVGSGTFIGSGTILDNDIKIGNNCVIGSGLTIKKNIKDNSIIK